LRYAVIVCPKCNKAKGIDTIKKTTTCPCGREIVFARTKFYFETDSPLELAGAVAEANAQLGDGNVPKIAKKPRKRDAYSSISERVRPIRDPVERMRVIASELTEAKGEFGHEDIKRVLTLTGRDTPEDIIAKLQKANLIYEVSEGRFRSV